MWNVTWRIYIRIAFFLACVNVFAAGKRKQMMSHVLTFGSLMFGAFYKKERNQQYDGKCD